MFAIAEAQDLNVLDLHGTARRRNFAGSAVEDAVVSPGECAFLDGDIAGDVQAMDTDMRVRERHEPPAVEGLAGRFPFAAHATGRFKDNVVSEHRLKSLKVVSVEGGGLPLKCVAHVHPH